MQTWCTRSLTGLSEDIRWNWYLWIKVVTPQSLPTHTWLQFVDQCDQCVLMLQTSMSTRWHDPQLWRWSKYRGLFLNTSDISAQPPVFMVTEEMNIYDAFSQRLWTPSQVHSPAGQSRKMSPEINSKRGWSWWTGWWNGSCSVLSGTTSDSRVHPELFICCVGNKQSRNLSVSQTDS